MSAVARLHCLSAVAREDISVKGNPIYLIDPDGESPRITVSQNAGTTHIKVQLNIIVKDYTGGEGIAHIKALEKEIREQFGNQKVVVDGKEVTVSFEINFEYAKSKEEYDKISEKLTNEGTTEMEYSPVAHKDKPEYQPLSENIMFGKNKVNQIAHEIAHDLGLADQYLEDQTPGESKGTAMPLKEYVGTMMATLNPFGDVEAKKLVSGVLKQKDPNGVYSPVENDGPKVGQVVTVIQNYGTEAAKEVNAKVVDLGSFTTTQGGKVKPEPKK